MVNEAQIERNSDALAHQGLEAVFDGGLLRGGARDDVCEGEVKEGVELGNDGRDGSGGILKRNTDK